jgi:N12 class adenine-specific DNA methylase
MTQLQLAFDFSAPPEPVLLGINPESIEALIQESSIPVKIPEIRAQDLEPELQPAAHKPKCQFLVLPEREAPKGVSRDYRITDADEVGQGNLKTKFQNNLAAIRLLKQLQEQQRTGISPEEKRILVRYCGWGALAQKAFKYDYEFYDLQRELRELLSEDEYDQASASTVNAHYTSPLVITALWRAATRLGIQAQSRILEPAAGIGHFLGLQPDQIKSNSRVAVELDTTSAAILALLYPDTTVRACGFQQPGLPLNFFDLAISNVPFGKYGVHDVHFKSKPRLCSAIHDYFFAKALAHIRPGGLLAFITSRYTLDKKDEYLRRHLDEHAVFLGAIRLPGGKDGAFAQNAGTEVTTDIIFLRKRHENETEAASSAWIETHQTNVPNESNVCQDAAVNQYFLDNPHMVLGQFTLAGSMYRENELTVQGHLTQEQLDSAIAHLPANVITYDQSLHEVPPSEIIKHSAATQRIKNGAFDVVDGSIVVRNGDVLTRPDFSPVSRKRIHAFIELRDTLRGLYSAQLQDLPDDLIVERRARLNSRYAMFLAAFGPLHTPANVKLLSGDPDFPVVLAIEDYNPSTHQPTKRPVFFQRTISTYTPPTTAISASDALSVSLREKGRIDWTRITELRPESTLQEIIRELDGLIYHNPESNRYETADEYLSGDVKAKLRAAETAAALDHSYQENVTALTAVQPKDLAPSQISARLGSPWIPTDVIEAFIYEVILENATLYGQNLAVIFAPQVGQWSVTVSDTVRSYATNSTKWAAFHLTGTTLVEMALNLRQPRIYQEFADGSRRLDVNATNRAMDVQQSIKDAFTSWLWQDVVRAQRLCQIYNDTYNCLRLREYDGSHLTFHGINPSVLRTGDLDSHQKNAVWRILQTGTTLLAHAVGAGKTYEMIAAGMEMKRMGLVRKPLYIVPNHLVHQWGNEFLALYPAANILIAGKDTFGKGRRQITAALIASGDYDAIVLSHKSFEYLPVSDATYKAFVEQETAAIREELERLKFTLPDIRTKSRRKNLAVKQLEAALRRLEKQLEDRLTMKRDDSIRFEELGIDFIFVDEAHMFKNLQFTTKMSRIASLSNSASNRALDMFLKTQYLAKRHNNRGVVFATATPVSNSMAELWTMQRYLSMHKLKALDLANFDNWAQQYGEICRVVELKPEGGGFRANNRFIKFVNLPELLKQFRDIADVRLPQDLNIPVPSIRTGSLEIITIPPSAPLKQFVASLGERAEKIRAGQVDSSIDNMLRVTHHGRLAALDMRLIDATLPDDPTSKVNTAVENIFQIWDNTRDTRRTQVVFLDLSIPHHTPAPMVDTTDEPIADCSSEDNGTDAMLDCSIYEDLRNKLIRHGVPASEIRFIHEAKTDTEKMTLFTQMNNGEIRILMGSTEKMGTGANIQQRLLALHHLDCPWRPSDLQQRNGRIHRQGNQNPEVMIFAYITQGSFDGYMWQGVGNKAKFIAQAMSGDLSIREIEDADAMVLTAAEATALSSDDPLIRERINVEIDVRRLLGLHAAHTDQQHYDRSRLLNLKSSLSYRQRKLTADREQFEDKQRWIAANPEAPHFQLPGVDEPKGIDLVRATKNQPNGGCVAYYGPFAVTVSHSDKYSRLETDFGNSPEFNAFYPDIAPSGSVLGTLTRHWNAIGGAISNDETQIQGMIRTIASLEATLASKAFPHQEQLDTKRARLKELDEHFKTIAAAEGGISADPDLDDQQAA